MKSTRLAFTAGLLILGWANAWAQNCNPAPANVATLKEIRPQSFTVEGPLAEFDSCHRSSQFQMPRNNPKPPLMMVLHGGAGLDLATRNAAEGFRSKGFASLVFDAFEHNGFYQGPQFWASKGTNEARQRMIYKVALSAYEWALKRTDIDTSQIYFHGLSNGAAVLFNIAGVVSPNHVKGIFAEGGPSAGLGLPDKLNVPLRLVYGKLDNYAGKTEDDMIWLRQEICLLNVVEFTHPSGNSKTCNAAVNPYGLTQSVFSWYEQQKSQGADIDIWFYDNAAHGMFLGPLKKNMITYGVDLRRFAWVGGDPSAKNKLLDDVDRFRQSKP
ncbi:MAG: hypothetical protein RIT44_609 [Pseudomonadota bacterium]|jgi:dienelactone hydrolase